MKAVDRQALSVGLATGAYGVSFGALSVASGLTVLQTAVLSLVMFTGGSQFALVGVLGAGGTGASAVAASTLLSLRNGLYAVEMSRLLRVRWPRRLAAAWLTIDESTAVAVGQDDPADARRGFWVTGLAIYVLWNASTLAGAVLGDRMGDPRGYGLDAAAAAAFLALLWPRLRGGRALGVAGGAVAVALAGAPFLPPGLPVLLAALVALGAVTRPAGRERVRA